MLLCGLGKGVRTAEIFARRKCDGAFQRQVEKEVCHDGPLSAAVGVGALQNKLDNNN
jgi:hypothetical protein